MNSDFVKEKEIILKKRKICDVSRAEIAPETFFYVYICPMRLKDLGMDDRPREKLRYKGAGVLSNAELLAILLRTGTGKMNVVDVARELLASADGKLGELATRSVEKMCCVSGVGPGKAVSIVAAFELGRRLAEEAGRWDGTQIDSPKKVCRMMLPCMRDLDHEECWVIFLNHSNRLITKERMTSGGQDVTIIDKRIIIRRALELKATSLILVHNHPSGSPTPSPEDIKQTRELSKALKSCDLGLLDHVIIAGNGYFSFSDEIVSYDV